ncbi:MAG: helix-turn-helix domain-containing protein, partial [Burkholderiaceae bacterium]|nr:helix-turn-helix domain-containing protein [Burkholderiaceae bacterium]
MTNQANLPKIQGDVFTRAREHVQLSYLDLAKMASLTESQVRQIENGEMGAFYSPAIKLIAAKKIAKILGLSEEECLIYADADDVPKQRPDHKKDSAQSISQLHQTIAKENFDQILLATQETGGQKKLKSYQKISLYLILVILGVGAFFSFYARADIVGFMPAYGERLVITSETCKWENGREEPNWLFAYFESSFGNVTRACYVRYNNQIW